ncbi:MAG: 16S rRNA (guanine(527)-N(7))-methyltransferase RsmG [Elusimicrobiota bacterium]
MQKSVEIKSIFDIAETTGCSISLDKAEKLVEYLEAIKNINKVINIVSRETTDNILINKHIYSSFIFIKSIEQILKERKIDKIADIGTGGGFPGVPIAILFNNIGVTLIDSVTKKTDFLQVLQKSLSIPNIQVINERAEILSHSLDYRERYDIVTARAVASTRICAEYGLALVKIGGYLITIKSLSQEKEIHDDEAFVEKMGGEISTQRFNRDIMVFIKKVKATPKSLPRPTHQIRK